MRRKTLHLAYWQPDNYRSPIEFLNHDVKPEPGKELRKVGVMKDKLGTVTGSPSTFYILDVVAMKFIFISESFKRLTGCDTQEFMDDSFSFYYRTWHDKDIVILKQLHQKLFNYFYATPVHERSRLRFSYNFRIKRRDSKCMDVLQQTVFPRIGDLGRPLIDFTTLTDISAFKKDHHIVLQIQKLNAAGEYEQVYKEEFLNYDFAFTPRQIEIMSMIGKGMTTKEIAARLFLSADTVKNHRKNILKMTGSKNVVEVYKSMIG